ncbi:MAG: hypothetical protein RMI34_08525 [Chloroherpetonaceae bacterium]|nr:hypothetical protein [Chloroherpetonaceae bacterium]
MKTFVQIGLVFLLAALTTSACVTPIAAPKPIKIPCTRLTKKEFIEKASQLLRANNYVVVEANEETGEVEGNRVPVYVGIGEHIIVSGPYIFDAVYDGTTITVNIQTVSEGRPVKSHDENSSVYDKRNFMPVLNGLRELCK